MIFFTEQSRKLQENEKARREQEEVEETARREAEEKEREGNK